MFCRSIFFSFFLFVLACSSFSVHASSIRGHVVDSRKTDVSGAQIIAYHINKDGYQPFWALSDDAGAFTFSNLDTGYYRLYCLPQASVNLIPTWYYKQTDREYAFVVHVQGSIDSLTFVCLSIAPSMVGNLSIYGTVELFSANDNKTDCKLCRKMQNELSSECRVTVLLNNSQGACVAWQQADTEGHFRFNQLPAGMYSIQFTEANYKTQTQNVILQSNQAVYARLQWSSDTVSTNPVLTASPILTQNGRMLVCTDSNVRVSVYSLNGIALLSSQEFPLSLADFAAGMYIVALSTKENSVYFKKIILD